ncbi:MAG: type II toxin-antitoxin system YafQ family toxin [Candidatus Omnitrophica bacterium]|nr:type II toxin-antitoxin system YafQ family toxin [Candidatus Omnitrophota bacterium]MBU0878252.1 type II toxin-antitoxin system YafQ family toxin [Candidatus Omnitrophota bacterium]MBU0896350.1 type II toxin-antitoxin system YafQ family toxin [Candidatus Omnitrophota bacterium]MBU1366623.1 type II toxin-antitoxin system YafQ family toxin [Candidatus Omnitrophota bacterium]MBU1524606.1 type II toxin-antitoxin system YafQ family toxin [Candidatus Omnitrophota bacterium]
MLNPVHTKQFNRDIKLNKKRGKDFKKIKEIMTFLIEKKTLVSKYKDHKLVGNFTECRECHIEPDWLLIYRVENDSIFFIRTGTHSDLFR